MLGREVIGGGQLPGLGSITKAGSLMSSSWKGIATEASASCLSLTERHASLGTTPSWLEGESLQLSQVGPALEKGHWHSH